MNSLLLWIGGLLVAVLGLMFAAPLLIDWNGYRGVFEEEVSRVLGRDVRVGGAINLRLLPSPYVRFEKVRISDSGAALGEPFFRAEAFTLWLSPTPLLRGAIEASEIELDQPVMRLAVDQDGRGNWQQFKITPGSLPMVPSDVVLQQMRIRNGLVSLKMPGASEPLTLSGIEGELAVSSIDGPYRFRGLVDWYGTQREIRIATSPREPDGKLRYKASVRGSRTGNTYVVDGELSEMTPRARHTGTITARLPIAGIFAVADKGASRSAAPRGSDAVDLKASFSGDIDGTRLSDIAFAFEHDGKPQLMSGEAAIAWRNGLRLETRLTSRWLDLDQIAAQDGRTATPADLGRRLIGQLSALLPPEGTSLVTFDIEQVNLGGEALSGVRLALARAGGLTSIGELKASLPGGARGELRGSLSPSRPAGAAAPPAADSDTFDGEVLLRGASYQRFATWAGAGALLPVTEQRRDGPFSIATRLQLMPHGIVVRDAHVELGGRQSTVNADWRWSGQQPRLDIVAEGRRIDIAAFAPGALAIAGPAPQKPGAGAVHAATGSTALVNLADRVAAIERSVGSFRLRLRAGELTDGATSLPDVDADIAINGRTLTVTSLRAGGGSLPMVEVAGELTGLGATAAGSLRGWVSTDSPAAMARLTELLPSGGGEQARLLLAGAARSEIGFRLALAAPAAASKGGAGAAVPAAAPEQVALTADGMLDDARLTLDLKLDGGLARWREAPIDLALRLDGPAAGGVLRRIAGISVVRSGPDKETVALRARATGASAASIIAVARLDTGQSHAEYDGRAAIAPDGAVELKGELMVTAPAASDIVALLGVGHRPQLAATAVRGTIDLERKSSVTTLATRGLDIGGNRVGGRIVLASRGDRVRVDGQVTASRLSIPGLMSLVLDGSSAAARGGETGEEPQRASSPWPDTTFSLALLDAAEGQITISAPAAGLTPEIELAESEMRLAFTPGKLEIQGLSGAALGGRFSAKGTIEAAPAGASVALEARLTGGQLARLGAVGSSARGGAGPRTPTSSGQANVVLSINGRALTPRGVMSVATGKGEVELRNARVRGIAASLVERAAVAAIEGKDEVTRAGLERILATERARSEISLGNRKLPIEVADGTVRIGALEITEPSATLRNTTTIDLAGLKVDSEWQISPRQPLAGAGQRREPLPSLAIIWTGPLSGIGGNEPRLAIDALEREIALRRVEREAERLETMRRQQEEERARMEAERQKRLELERANSAAPGAAPVYEVPLPINPPQPMQVQPGQVQPGQVQPGQVQPGQAPTSAEPGRQPATDPPPPRVTRPPVRSQRGDARTLQEMLLSPQP